MRSGIPSHVSFYAHSVLGFLWTSSTGRLQPYSRKLGLCHQFLADPRPVASKFCGYAIDHSPLCSGPSLDSSASIDSSLSPKLIPFAIYHPHTHLTPTTISSKHNTTFSCKQWPPSSFRPAKRSRSTQLAWTRTTCSMSWPCLGGGLPLPWCRVRNHEHRRSGDPLLEIRRWARGGS